MNCTKQMSTYHDAWPQVIPSWTGGRPVKAATSSFNFGSSAIISSKIPAIPFLVPAVIEKLQGSPRYGDITAVLPGEADLYCARYVKEHGGIVFTGDSDLLVHDLGDMGSVAFFKDLELPDSANTTKSLRCHQYRIAVIVERLGLKPSHGLQALAFEMFMDPHGSLPKLLQKARDLKAVLEYPGMYQDFSKEYDPLPREVHTSEGPEITPQKSLQAILRTLDPRISEYVLQFPTAAAAAERPFRTSLQSVEKLDSVDVFLPFLLDCPSKTSAWEMSTAVRQLAYGLMNLVEAKENQIASVIEHRRQQNGSRGRTWQLPTYDEIQEACTALTGLVDNIDRSLLSLPDFDIWRAMAFHQDLAYACSSGKQSLGQSIIKAGGPQKRLSWEIIHFSAQVQASYYSFRMLKQIMKVVLACKDKDNDVDALSSTLSNLDKKLKSLPPLAAMPTFYNDLQLLGGSVNLEAFVAVCKLFEGDNKDASAEENTSKPPKKAKKKKRKREQATSISLDMSKRPNNMFDILDSI